MFLCINLHLSLTQFNLAMHALSYEMNFELMVGMAIASTVQCSECSQLFLNEGDRLAGFQGFLKINKIPFAVHW